MALTQKKKANFIKKCISSLDRGNTHIKKLVRQRKEILMDIIKNKTFGSGGFRYSPFKKKHVPGTHRTKIGYL